MALGGQLPGSLAQSHLRIMAAELAHESAMQFGERFDEDFLANLTREMYKGAFGSLLCTAQLNLQLIIRISSRCSVLRTSLAPDGPEPASHSARHPLEGEPLPGGRAGRECREARCELRVEVDAPGGRRARVPLQRLCRGVRRPDYDAAPHPPRSPQSHAVLLTVRYCFGTPIIGCTKYNTDTVLCMTQNLALTQ